MSQSDHRPDIQGMRGIAVLSVVLFHARVVFPGGFVGVDVFFVISGYVITRMLMRERSGTGTTRLGRFYVRRAHRLLPATALMVSTVLLADLFLEPVGASGVAGTGIAATLFMANVWLARIPGDGYFDLASEANPLLHTWTLSVEEQFYLMFPLALVGAWWLARRFARPGLVAVTVAVAAVVSFGLGVVLTGGDVALAVAPSSAIAFYSPFTRAWEFAAGALLALVGVGVARRSVAIGLGAAGAILLLYSFLAFDSTTPMPGTAALVPVLGATLLVVAGSDSRGWGRVLSVRPLTWMGDISYSWYLWHWPAIVFATALVVDPRVVWPAVLGGLLSLVPAVLSFRFVERRFRVTSANPARRTPLLVAVCLVVPLALGALAMAAGPRLEQRPAVADFLAATSAHLDRTSGCAKLGGDTAPLDQARPPDCTWDRPGEEVAVLFGDSNAGQLTEGFLRATEQMGVDAVVHTTSRCPINLVSVVDSGERDTQCEQFVSGTVEQLLADPPDFLVVAAASDLYLGSADFALADPAGGSFTTDQNAKAELWTRQMRAMLGRIRDAGTKVVVVHPIPKFGLDEFISSGRSWQAQRCARGLVMVAQEMCGIEQSKSSMLDQRAPAFAAEQDAVERTEGAVGVDLADAVCPGDRCATWRGDAWWYRDGLHLSIAASEQVAPDLRTAMERASR